jgi:ribose 5-phosphate isomerase B
MKKVIAIGCDHAATAYKNSIVHVLTQKGYEVHDKGTHSEESVDYPDYAHPVALEVEKGIAEKGILLCGSANGVCITIISSLSLFTNTTSTRIEEIKQICTEIIRCEC